jgi:hypothetical protein
VWRSRTPDGVRFAHFPSVITTIMDHKLQLLKPMNLGELYTAHTVKFEEKPKAIDLKRLKTIRLV